MACCVEVRVEVPTEDHAVDGRKGGIAQCLENTFDLGETRRFFSGVARLQVKRNHEEFLPRLEVDEGQEEGDLEGWQRDAHPYVRLEEAASPQDGTAVFFGVVFSVIPVNINVMSTGPGGGISIVRGVTE